MSIRVLVIGVGSMGSGMALHLSSQGEASFFDVLAYDEYPPALSKFTIEYSRILPESIPSKGELISKQASISSIEHLVNPFPGNLPPHVIILMVINSKQIEDFLFAPVNGKAYVETLPASCTILIMSTCSPSSVLHIHSRLLSTCSSPPTLLDAPVSGGPIKARDGQLSIMTSVPDSTGDEPHLKVLRALSKEGASLCNFPPLRGSSTPLGAGSMAKTLHQLLAGVHIASAAESLTLASQCGLDLEAFYALLVGGAAGNSWMFGDRGRRMIESLRGDAVEAKSKVTIFIKDLGIVLEEAQRVTGNTSAAPLAETSLRLFQDAVAMGLGDEDDSSLWRVYAQLSRPDEAADALIFNDRTIVEVADEPFHKVKVSNAYTRAILVSFSEGATTLPHTHAEDSVYIFLSPHGARVRNHIRGAAPVSDSMCFGEIRYGSHCGCALTHRIYAEIGGGGVFCVDAEVLAPPPRVFLHGECVAEVEVLAGHEVVKLREKVRVFRLLLAPGESIELEYLFYHLVVVSHAGMIEVVENEVSSVETKAAGEVSWHGPLRGRRIVNVGSSDFGYFVIQWRNFA